MKLCIRIFVSLLAATFVWLLAPAARAAAPLCDSRGAITFAPNVVLEEPNASVDVGEADDCSGANAADFSLEHGRGTNAQASADDGARALVAQSPMILPAAPADVLEDAAATFVAPAGVRFRVDRPPRG